MTTIPPLQASHVPGPTPIDEPLVSVLIPVYNEEVTLEQVVRRVAQLDVAKEILIIDDGSKDRSIEIAERLADEFAEGRTIVRSLPQPQNLGKGAAVRAGIGHSEGDIVLIQDADLEYDPGDLPALLEPLITGHADVVYGSRFSGGQPQRAHLFLHYVGNKFLTLITRALFNTTLSDMEVGYKAFRGELIRSLHLTSNDFRIEPEMTARVLRKPEIRLYEVPISYFGRSFDEGKKITWRDGIKALRALLQFRFD
jgi:glycosyltransferase involved in cell wall biosynthesis